MRYMLAFYEPQDDFTARDGPGSDGFWPAWRAYFAAMREADVNIGGAPLQAPDTAATVRRRGERSTVEDGPYADTKEQLGGFVIVDVPSLDEALQWARRAPCSANGAVEVRPVWPSSSDCADAMMRVDPAVTTYAMMIYESEEHFEAREGPYAEQYWATWGAFSQSLDDAGIRRSGAPLRGPESATLVRAESGRSIVHDGPYADTKEQLGGFLLLDVASRADALEWAARCPATSGGAVEIRPVLPVLARV